jgi:hypothetical protein
MKDMEFLNNKILHFVYIIYIDKHGFMQTKLTKLNFIKIIGEFFLLKNKYLNDI